MTVDRRGTWKANCVSVEDLDHVVIHVDDWDATHAFYLGVLGLERVENPEAAGNPLDACSYRIGSHQVDVHGPWPGQTGTCCPPPYNEVGRSELALRTSLLSDEVVSLLLSNGVAVATGPVRRFGAGGWGTSVYGADPSGNEVELISYGER